MFLIHDCYYYCNYLRHLLCKPHKLCYHMLILLLSFAKTAIAMKKKGKIEDDHAYDPQTFRVPDAKAEVIRAIPFTDEIKTKNADFGPLKQLAGTWISAVDKTGYGIHTTCMPSPGTTPGTIPGIFHFLSEQYTEEMTFTLIEKGVRNRAGTNEQMVGAVKYDQSIKNDKGVGIHEETGMYMNLGDMYYHAASKETIKTDLGGKRLQPGDGGQPFVPTHKLARSGTIPHGNSILLLGSGDAKRTGAPIWPAGKN